MAAVTICSDFGAQKIKSDTISTLSPWRKSRVGEYQASLCHTDMYLFYSHNSGIITFPVSQIRTLTHTEFHAHPKFHKEIMAVLRVKAREIVSKVKFLVTVDLKFKLNVIQNLNHFYLPDITLHSCHIQEGNNWLLQQIISGLLITSWLLPIFFVLVYMYINACVYMHFEFFFQFLSFISELSLSVTLDIPEVSN